MLNGPAGGNPIPALGGLQCAVHGLWSAYLGPGLVEGAAIGLAIGLVTAFVGLKFKLRWIILLSLAIAGMILYSTGSAWHDTLTACGFPGFA